MALIDLYEYLRWRHERDREHGRHAEHHHRRHVYGVRIDTFRPRHLGDADLTPVAIRHGHRHHHRRNNPVASLIFDPSGTDTQKLPVTVQPIDGSGSAIPGVSFAAVSWTVTDPNVATIVKDDTGQQYVLPLAAGSVDFTVTATTDDGTSFTDGLHVDISSTEPPQPPAPAIAGVRIVVGDPVPANPVAPPAPPADPATPAA